MPPIRGYDIENFAVACYPVSFPSLTSLNQKLAPINSHGRTVDVVTEI